MVLLELSIDIIFPAVIWPWGRLRILTRISTSNTSWWVNAAGAYGWHPNHFHVPIVRNLGASTSCNLRAMSRPVTRISYGFSVVEPRVSSGICITLYNFSHTRSTRNSPFWEAHIRTPYHPTSSIYTTRSFISVHSSPPIYPILNYIHGTSHYYFRLLFRTDFSPVQCPPQGPPM